MPTVKTFESAQDGPVKLDLIGYNENIHVQAQHIPHARIELHTAADDGPTVDLLNGLSVTDLAGLFALRLPRHAGSSGITIQSGGNVVMTGSGSISISEHGRGFSSMSGIQGDADMNVNGQRIQVRGGKVFVNGVAVQAPGGVPVQSAPMPITIRAYVPLGSAVTVESYNGDISVAYAARVTLKSYNGDVSATGIQGDSTVTSYNGDIKIGSAEGLRPTVTAKTYNGDVQLLDEDMRARPQTRNGQVIYPS